MLTTSLFLFYEKTIWYYHERLGSLEGATYSEQVCWAQIRRSRVQDFRRALPGPTRSMCKCRVQVFHVAHHQIGTYIICSNNLLRLSTPTLIFVLSKIIPTFLRAVISKFLISFLIKPKPSLVSLCTTTLITDRKKKWRLLKYQLAFLLLLRTLSSLGRLLKVFYLALKCTHFNYIL